MLYAGLVAFTDADLTRLPAASECNETLGILPCFQGSCYYAEQQCDGERQCEDGADELGCASKDDVPTERPTAYKELLRLERELDDHTFAWKTGFIKPHGDARIGFDVPIMPQLWVLGAFSLHPENGLAFNEHPLQVRCISAAYFHHH
ncbi:hypothetical protein LSAT2_007429 [Lamellibrachia satsuma]|nr:hypothetical protein LSAT2_007429 [Lamellibrachia satsuma]